MLLMLVGGFAGCTDRQGRKGGCTKDTDCREGRICVQNVCRYPLPEERCCPCPDAATPEPDHLKMDLSMPESVHPWPMFGGNWRRTGRSSLKGPAENPQVLWRFKAGGPISGGVVVDSEGRVFFGSHDGNVYALSSDGKLLWRHKTGDKIWGAPALNEAGDLVVAGSDDDHLYGLSTKNGRLVFKVKLGECDPDGPEEEQRLRRVENAAPDTVRCDVDGSPLFDSRGRIAVGGEGLYFLSPKGEILASYNEGRHVRSSPAFREDGVYIFGSRDDRVHAIDEKGRVVWSFATRSDVDSTPALASDGTVYVGSDDGRLYALTPDGKLKWTVLTGAPVRAAPALGRDGTVYFGSHNGRLYAVDPSSGKARWAFPTTGRIESSPVVDGNGNIFFGSQDGRFYCLDRNGKMLWRFDSGNDVDSTAAIAPGGRIYFGNDDGVLFALGSAG